MTDRDQYLRERTNKGFADLTKRLLSTPVDERKALLWLVNRLHTKKMLTDEDIDDLLFDARPIGE